MKMVKIYRNLWVNPLLIVSVYSTLDGDTEVRAVGQAKPITLSKRDGDDYCTGEQFVGKIEAALNDQAPPPVAAATHHPEIRCCGTCAYFTADDPFGTCSHPIQLLGAHVKFHQLCKHFTHPI